MTRPAIHTVVKRLLSTQTRMCKRMIKQSETDVPHRMGQEMEKIKKQRKYLTDTCCLLSTQEKKKQPQREDTET